MEDRLYRIYKGMKSRCYIPSATGYSRYGARGIGVCNEWKSDYGSFKNWALENGYNDTLSIDRIDNNGDYSPDNCRWATKKQQQRNTRSNKLVEIDGVSRPQSEWCEMYGISTNTFRSRLRLGWDPVKALTTGRYGKYHHYLLTLNDKTQSLTAWAKELGMRPDTLWRRIDRGWPIEKALTTPIGRRS